MPQLSRRRDFPVPFSKPGVSTASTSSSRASLSRRRLEMNLPVRAGAGYRRMIELSAAGRAGTLDQVETVRAILLRLPNRQHFIGRPSSTQPSPLGHLVLLRSRPQGLRFADGYAKAGHRKTNHCTPTTSASTVGGCHPYLANESSGIESDRKKAGPLGECVAGFVRRDRQTRQEGWGRGSYPTRSRPSKRCYSRNEGVGPG